MTALTRFIREYLLAIQFFTRIPVTGRLADWVGFSPELLRASAAHFPGIGAVVGVAAAGVYYLLQTRPSYSSAGLQSAQNCKYAALIVLQTSLNLSH